MTRGRGRYWGGWATHDFEPSKPTGRKPLPAHLPREEVVHRPADDDLACPLCRQPRTCIGAERAEILDWIPATFRVLAHVRQKYACSVCHEGVAIAPVPDRVIEGGLPSAGLLGHVLVAKVRDHLPLNRQVAIFQRAGVERATSTLCGWVREGAELLAPIAQAIHARALSAHALQIDDTGLRVLDRSHPDGVRRGHLWGLVGDRTWASFRYTPTWEGKAARALAGTRVGWLQADGYAGFGELFKRPGATAIEVGCMATARTATTWRSSAWRSVTPPPDRWGEKPAAGPTGSSRGMEGLCGFRMEPPPSVCGAMAAAATTRSPSCARSSRAPGSVALE